jgi:hypothetical protein
VEKMQVKTIILKSEVQRLEKREEEKDRTRGEVEEK